MGAKIWKGEVENTGFILYVFESQLCSSSSSALSRAERKIKDKVANELQPY